MDTVNESALRLGIFLVVLAIMLVWAGIIESFLSQHHQPVIPYSLKIIFGLVQLAALAAFLGLSGRRGSNCAEDI